MPTPQPEELIVNATSAIPEATGSAAAGTATSAGDTGSIFDSITSIPGQISSALESSVPGITQNIFGFPSGSLLNLPSDIGNFAAGTGDFSSILGDISNPIAGFTGGLLASAFSAGNNVVGRSIGGTIGATAGSFILPPFGTFVGSFLGSEIGSLFGQQHPVSSFGLFPLTTTSEGTLSLGNPESQAFPQLDKLHSGLTSQVDSFNQLLTTAGLKASFGDVPGIVLGNDFTPGSTKQFSTNIEFSDLTKVIPNIRFSSDNPTIGNLVNGVSFPDVNSLISTISTGKLADNVDLHPTSDFGFSVTSPASEVSQIIAEKGSAFQLPPGISPAFANSPEFAALINPDSAPSAPTFDNQAGSGGT